MCSNMFMRLLGTEVFPMSVCGCVRECASALVRGCVCAWVRGCMGAWVRGARALVRVRVLLCACARSACSCSLALVRVHVLCFRNSKTIRKLAGLRSKAQPPLSGR